MIDVIEFNEKYLISILEYSLADRKIVSNLFNIDNEQINEIVQLSKESIKTIANSPVTVVEPVFNIVDLKRSAPASTSPESVINLNFLYLSMLRNLAQKDIRIAFFATRASAEICEMLNRMTTSEIQRVAKSNKIMFRCLLPTKSIAKANRFSTQPDLDKCFLRHLPLLTLNVCQGARL